MITQSARTDGLALRARRPRVGGLGEVSDSNSGAWWTRIYVKRPHSGIHRSERSTSRVDCESHRW